MSLAEHVHKIRVFISYCLGSLTSNPVIIFHVLLRTVYMLWSCRKYIIIALALILESTNDHPLNTLQLLKYIPILLKES